MPLLRTKIDGVVYHPKKWYDRPKEVALEMFASFIFLATLAFLLVAFLVLFPQPTL